jgi:hypothetical protein
VALKRLILRNFPFFQGKTGVNVNVGLRRKKTKTGFLRVLLAAGALLSGLEIQESKLF